MLKAWVSAILVSGRARIEVTGLEARAEMAKRF